MRLRASVLTGHHCIYVIEMEDLTIWLATFLFSDRFCDSSPQWSFAQAERCSFRTVPSSILTFIPSTTRWFQKRLGISSQRWRTKSTPRLILWPIPSWPRIFSSWFSKAAITSSWRKVSLLHQRLIAVAIARYPLFSLSACFPTHAFLGHICIGVRVSQYVKCFTIVL